MTGIAMQETISTRSNAFIDPGLHVWHGEVAGYLFLGGLVAGILVLAGVALWLRSARPGVVGPSRAFALLPWTAPVLLSAGMILLWLDLENGFNAFRFYLVVRPLSPMSWGAWILVGVYPASLALAWRASPPALRDGALAWLERRVPALAPRAATLDGWLGARERSIGALAVLAGVALGIYTGLLLGTLSARPLWSSPVLGPLFLASGLSTGAAFLLLGRLHEAERRLLGRVDMGLIALELALLALWMTGLANGGAASREALALLLGGPYTAAFWTLVVALGLLTPLVGEWVEARHGLVPVRLTAALVLVGGFALRWILVYAGQHAAWSALALH
jgi:formate-dependent nitrite reductase membrane component NrfD